MDIETITSCCNFVKLQDSDATSNLCWTLYLHTHTFSSIQDQNSLMLDDSYREIFTDLFLLFILWALFCTCIQMPFYTGCCIYIPGQAFFLIIIILSVMFLFTRSSLFVCQYVCVCHISFSGEGLEFQTNTHPIFQFHFIFKCTHFLDREQTVWLFSQCIFVQIYMESGEGGRSTIGVCSLQIQLYWIS